MTRRKERCDGCETREAILDAAEEEFSDKGFELASMREICRKADANSALASRYFGSKAGLYRVVAKRLFGDLGAPMTVLAASVRDDATWKAAVREWVADFLYMTMPTAKAQKRCAGLFRHEVTAPTKFHVEFMRAFGKPVYDALHALIAMKVKDAHRIELMTSSVWAQVAVYALSDSRLHASFRPKGVTVEAWREKVCDHVCENVYGGVK